MLSEEGASHLARALYKRIKSDPDLAPFFAGISLAHQSERMAEVLAHANRYRTAVARRYLVEIHAPLIKRGLKVEHFDRVVDCLVASLEELGLSAQGPTLLKYFGPLRSEFFEVAD